MATLIWQLFCIPSINEAERGRGSGDKVTGSVTESCPKTAARARKFLSAETKTQKESMVKVGKKNSPIGEPGYLDKYPKRACCVFALKTAFLFVRYNK